MQLTAQKSLATTNNTVKYDCRLFGGMYIYVDYTADAETKMTMTFKVTDSKLLPTQKMFSILANGAAYSIDLIEGSNVYPVPVPESSDILEITFTPTGDATDAIVTVFANGDLASR